VHQRGLSALLHVSLSATLCLCPSTARTSTWRLG